MSPKEIQQEAVNKGLRLAKKLCGEGFEDITQDEVNKLINANFEPLIDEDLVELMKFASEEEWESTDPEQEEEKDLTLERLSPNSENSKEVAKDD